MRPMFSLLFLVIFLAAAAAGGSGESDAMMAEDDAMMAGPPTVRFTTLAAAQEYAVDGKALLFFTASWCPTCMAANRDIEQNYAKLPSDLTIILVDYDSESEMKSRYGITYQHTFVQIDSTGRELLKWNGGGVDDIARRLL